MELNIGTNIRRLRLAKGFTQEQLAELLCISTAAVSKWEAKNSYPDITMLFPLADIFGVSVDVLLGYDEAKTKAEIEKMLGEYRELYRNGHFAKASELLVRARKKYPNDYLVMHAYMWDKAGGTAANRADILLQSKGELIRICDCILDGCTDENIRFGALNMKAKLLHAEKDTKGALEILSRLPAWGSCAEQKKEQLFAKDSPEYRYWNKSNCYGLMDAMAIKLARTVRFDTSLSIGEKIIQLESMGDEFSELSKKPNFACFCIVEQAVYSILAGALSADDPLEDVIRIREKQFAAMEKMMRLAETDGVLKEHLKCAYGTDDILAWKVDQLLHSPHPQFAMLRGREAYMKMLSKWER